MCLVCQNFGFPLGNVVVYDGQPSVCGTAWSKEVPATGCVCVCVFVHTLICSRWSGLLPRTATREICSGSCDRSSARDGKKGGEEGQFWQTETHQDEPLVHVRAVLKQQQDKNHRAKKAALKASLFFDPNGHFVISFYR